MLITILIRCFLKSLQLKCTNKLCLNAQEMTRGMYAGGLQSIQMRGLQLNGVYSALIEQASSFLGVIFIHNRIYIRMYMPGFILFKKL